MKKFFINYFFSILQLLILLFLSPAIIDNVGRDIFFYILMLAVIGITSFSLEPWYNKTDEGKAKKRKLYFGYFVFPMNFIVVAMFILFIF